MIVTESLASGLKNRFFREIEDVNWDLKESLYAGMPRYRSKTDWPLVKKFFESALGVSKVISYEGGSAKQPYLMLSSIVVVRDRPLNSWRENCLFGKDLCISPIVREVSCEYSGYSIGEHAISRIFLRTRHKEVGNLAGIDAVNRQLIYAPLWSNFWWMLLPSTTLLAPDDQIFPVIPAPEGLLLCVIDKKSYILEIRTFVSDFQLTNEQIEIKSILESVSLKYFESPGSFNVKSNGTVLDDGLLMRCAIANELCQSGSLDLILKSAFRNFHDDGRRVKVRSELGKVVERFGECFSLDCRSVFERMGSRKFHTFLKNVLNNSKSSVG